MGRGDDAHWALSRRLAEALGATAAELAHPRVAPAALDYVDWVLELSRQEYGLVTLAAMSIGGGRRREKTLQRVGEGLGGKEGPPPQGAGIFFAPKGGGEGDGGAGDKPGA